MDNEWHGRMIDLSEQLRAILREHDEDGIGESARLYDRIDRLFNLFSCGEDYAAGRMIEYLSGAKEELLKDQAQDFDGARRDMFGWQGEAAENFVQEYLNPLQDGVNLMIDRIDTLNMILQAHQILVRRMREDVLDIVDGTLKGIAEAESDGWKIGAAVVGAVAGFAGTVASAFPGGPGLVLGMIALSMTEGAVGVVSSAKGADDELGVIVQFVDSGEELLHQIDIERNRIERGFRELANSVTDAKLPEVRPARPYVVTAPDFRPESFGMTDVAQAGHPVPTDTSDLVPEPKKKQTVPSTRPPEMANHTTATRSRGQYEQPRTRPHRTSPPTQRRSRTSVQRDQTTQGSPCTRPRSKRSRPPERRRHATARCARLWTPAGC